MRAKQRRHHPEARPHLGHEVVGRGGVDDMLGRDMDGAAGIGIVARPLARDHDVDAVIAENALQQNDVGEPRHVLQDQRVLGQQARDHQRQRGVLGARNRDRAVQALSADNAYSIHARPARCGHCSCKPDSTLAGQIRRKSDPQRPFSRRRVAPALLRLAPPQVFPQRRGQPRVAARGLLRLLVVLALAGHSVIIGRPRDTASSAPKSSLCLAPIGAVMAVSAAFAPPATGPRLSLP